MGKSQPIYLPSLVNNFFDHMWASLGSTGREPLQTCPSLTKLLPISIIFLEKTFTEKEKDKDKENDKDKGKDKEKD